MATSVSAFFVCMACNTELSPFLERIPAASLHLARDTAAVPPGQYAVLASPWSYRHFVTGGQPGSFYSGSDNDVVAFEAGDFLLHPDDVRHLVSKGAAFGCCGYQPREEMNATCPNGHPIGTLHSDCWAAHIFRLSARHVHAVVA